MIHIENIRATFCPTTAEFIVLHNDKPIVQDYILEYISACDHETPYTGDEGDFPRNCEDEEQTDYGFELDYWNAAVIGNTTWDFNLWQNANEKEIYLTAYLVENGEMNDSVRQSIELKIVSE